jgi:hypothetical protein
MDHTRPLAISQVRLDAAASFFPIGMTYTTPSHYITKLLSYRLQKR